MIDHYQTVKETYSYFSKHGVAQDGKTIGQLILETPSIREAPCSNEFGYSSGGSTSIGRTLNLDQIRDIMTRLEKRV